MRSPVDDRLTISQVAKRTNVHVDNLLLWEKRGHIPRVGRDEAGARRFGEADVAAILAFSRELKRRAEPDEVTVGCVSCGGPITVARWSRVLPLVCPACHELYHPVGRG